MKQHFSTTVSKSVSYFLVIFKTTTESLIKEEKDMTPVKNLIATFSPYTYSHRHIPAPPLPETLL